MSTSELITDHHLARKAIIYIRQSTPHQVLSHQESRRLQYALRDRALSLGWREKDIEIIDADQGTSATTAQHREGFKEILTRVTMGEVGIIFSREVTRLSRNCSDWYPLLDICGYRGCLIADNDGIYDPATPNGRLLLGLKGQLSELELHTIRSRLTAGLLNKAKRGELALCLPVGLLRHRHGPVEKEPHQEVQQRIELIFSTFLRLGSASKVLIHFNEEGLLIPRRNRFGDLIWKRPSVSAILSFLKNPAYAGAFVYGRRRSIRKDLSSGKASQRMMPMDQWKIIVKDIYPAYISWETFEKIQAMLKDNYAEYNRNKSRGIPREGAALLHGIIYCGQCGHKMVIQYKQGTRYLCNALRQQYRVPVCQNIPADPIDAQVVKAFFEALSPAELDAYAQSLKRQSEVDEQMEQARIKQLQRLRYEASLAQRRFDQVDPENRLVASELERRWEDALRELRQAEESFELRKYRAPAPELSEELKEAFKTIGKRLPEVWNTPILPTTKKKSLLRTLIDKVVIHRTAKDVIHTRIVWKGGATTTFMIPVPVGSLGDLSELQEMERIILDLAARGMRDEEIAGHLSGKGYRSPMKDHLLASTVRKIRLTHRVLQTPSQSHPTKVPGYLSVSQVAEKLGISKHWIYDRIHNGSIAVTPSEKNLYLFPDEPATLEKFKKLLGGHIDTIEF